MKEFVLLLPELFLVITLAGIIVGEIGYHGERVRLISVTALLGLAGAFIETLLTYKYGTTQIFNNAISIDGISLFFKLFFLVLGGLAVVTSMHTREIPRERHAEYCALILASTLAMCLAASSADLILVFLSLQFMNILSYFLAAYSKRSPASTEAAIKYLTFGAVSATFFLFGVAILFFATRSINIYEMHQALMARPLGRETGLAVFMMMFLSLCFQLGAFPMQLWAPDVFEGSPTPVSAFLSLGSRAAGIAVALRFFIVVFSQPGSEQGQWQVLGALDWPQVVALTSGLTMILGGLLAFRQTSAKRLVAYLVIMEAGFLLIGLLVMDEVGLAALLYSLVVELFALIGVYYVLAFLYDELKSDRLADLKGVLPRAVPECISLVLFLVCLVGLPPFPGFIGKFALIGAAIRHHWYFLAIVAICSTALATVSVARLAYSLLGDFRQNSAPIIPHHTPRRVFLAALLLPMLMVGIFAQWVLAWAGQSLRFIFW